MLLRRKLLVYLVAMFLYFKAFFFQTKDGGRVYTHAIRQLYYSLLADQIPPANIERTIRTILKCFFPFLKLENLQLPSESCASYMRRHELATVSSAHKATSVLQQAETGFLHLNTDGTTKYQKKIEGAALNGMVLPVNNVTDGSANSMVEDISRELKKLRETAHALKLPNGSKINWTLIVSSSSDSASTQKRFNKLLMNKGPRTWRNLVKFALKRLTLLKVFAPCTLVLTFEEPFSTESGVLLPLIQAVHNRKIILLTYLFMNFVNSLAGMVFLSTVLVC